VLGTPAKLANRYVSDPEFRTHMSQDPEEMVKRYGVQVDEEIRQTLRGID
jgi:hypothetical protein